MCIYVYSDLCVYRYTCINMYRFVYMYLTFSLDITLKQPFSLLGCDALDVLMQSCVVRYYVIPCTCA